MNSKFQSREKMSKLFKSPEVQFTASFEENGVRTNDTSMDSPNTSTHMFIIFLVLFPAGGVFNSKNSPSVPNSAETGLGPLYVQSTGVP